MISNDDPLPLLTVSNVSIPEGNSGSRSLVFTLSLSAASNQMVSVAYATANDTPTAGSDYTAKSGTAHLQRRRPGADHLDFHRRRHGGEGDETFWRQPEQSDRRHPGHHPGQGTIVNDEPVAPLSVNDVR